MRAILDQSNKTSAVRPLTPFVVDNTYHVDPTSKGRLGEGAFSMVCRATQPGPTPLHMACKMIRLSHYEKYYENERVAFIRLHEVWASGTHVPASLITCYRYGADTINRVQFGLLFLELLPSHTLADELHALSQTERHLPPRSVFHYARQLAQALATLHRAGIAHHDIKVENVALDRATDRVVLFDLGFALTCPAGTATTPYLRAQYRITNDKMTSPMYMAPEQTFEFLELNPFAADVWQFGQLCYHMMTNAAMFDACKTLDVLFAALRKEQPAVTRHPIIHSNRAYQELLEVMLVYSPPSMRATIEHVECKLARMDEEEDEETWDIEDCIVTI